MRLDAGIAADLISAQFPDLAGQPVRQFGAGWDHYLVTAGDEWIFRFPRRAERVPWLLREIQIMDVLAAEVAPRYELAGRPSSTFPYPFVGYRRVPGVGADRSPVTNLAGLAADVGAVLSRLHNTDTARVPPTPSGWERESWAQLREELAAQAGLVRPLLPEGLCSAAEPYLTGNVAEPEQDGPQRFIHNDICPDHLIVDPSTGRLAGLIDFTDAMVGEVVLDFVGLIGVAGYEFIGQVAAHYDLPLGAGFGRKLAWLARTLTLTWLADAAQLTPADVSKHLTWTARAFGQSWEPQPRSQQPKS